MIRTFPLHSIQSMLNSCDRLSATVTAKEVTLILSTIVLLQGLPAGSRDQAQGLKEGGLVHLAVSAPTVCRAVATPTLCLPYEGSSCCVRSSISLCQIQHIILYQYTLMQPLTVTGCPVSTMNAFLRHKDQ